MNYIKLDFRKGSPEEQAKKAYENEYYIEAIQIIHAWIESQARGLLIAISHKTFGTEISEAWQTSDSYSLDQLLKLFKLFNQISNEEYAKFKELNRLRNKVVHQVVVDPHDEEYRGVPKDTYDKVFYQSIEEAWFFTEKNEEYYARDTT